MPPAGRDSRVRGGQLGLTVAQDIEWFLGRDGQQYGPIKNEEMETLVRLGQLRDTDLLWRTGFGDWLPAFDALGLSDAIIPASEPMPTFDPSPPTDPEPAPTPEPEPAASPAVSPAPDPAAVEPAGSPVAAAPLPAHAPAPAPDPIPAAPPEPAPAPVNAEPLPVPSNDPAPIPAAAAAPAVAAPADAGRRPEPARVPAAPAARTAPTEGGGWPTDAPQPAPIPTLTELLARAPEARGPEARGPEPGRRPAPTLSTPAAWSPPRAAAGPQPAATPARGPDPAPRPRPPAQAVGPKRQRRIAGVLLVTVLALGTGGAIYALWDEIAAATGSFVRTSGVSSNGAEVPAPRPAARPTTETATARPDPGPPNRPPYAANPVWGYVATDFPEWYGERMREAARLAERPDPSALQKYLADSLVSLRRTHSGDALSASHGRIRAIATAFVANLDVLKEASIDACYDFISHGEASDSVVQRLKETAVATAIDAQLAAVFEAIREGRRQPLSHLPPKKTDYDTLADELVKLGWTDTDLKTFSDPRQLSRAAPDVVCRLVRDWFRAHLAIADTNVQLRLLIESLKPVVAG